MLPDPTDYNLQIIKIFSRHNVFPIHFNYVKLIILNVIGWIPEGSGLAFILPSPILCVYSMHFYEF